MAAGPSCWRAATGGRSSWPTWTPSAPDITARYRAGDIRHCFANIEKSRALLGFEPQVAFDEGLEELAGYLAYQIAEDRAEKATEELLQRGLVA